MKPCIYAANVNENDLQDEVCPRCTKTYSAFYLRVRLQGLNNSQVQKLRETAHEEGAGVIVVSAQV